MPAVSLPRIRQPRRLLFAFDAVDVTADRLTGQVLHTDELGKGRGVAGATAG
jgi:hypothetical protein